MTYDPMAAAATRRTLMGMSADTTGHDIPRVALGSPTATVEDVMTPDPICAGPDETVHQALERMRVGGFHHLPVRDRNDAVVGVATRVDLLLAGAQDGHGNRRVLGLPISPAVSVLRTTPLAEAAGHLLNDHVACLLVVDADEEVVGIVTPYDILRLAARGPVAPGPAVGAGARHRPVRLIR